MPRIRPQEFLKARAINKALLSLLPVCRDLSSARNEFRWMKEHAINVSHRLGYNDHPTLLRSLVKRRAQGEPLQYILESEYFGHLEIKCRPGVLIPRQETAASVSYLAQLVSRASTQADGRGRRLRVLDLCTGSGCIPLLFHHEYYRNEHAANDELQLVGVDISPTALSLARQNLLHQIALRRHSYESVKQTRSLNSIGFVQADVLRNNQHSPSEALEEHGHPPPLLHALHRLNSNDNPPNFDILISNPPYISPKSFKSTTSRSVRKFEPKLALVPDSADETGDLFYPHLLRIASEVNAKMVLFEVADLEQAKRVAELALKDWENVEIWRDDPNVDCDGKGTIEIKGKSIPVRGRGNGRSVFAYSSEASKWRLPLQTGGDTMVVSDPDWPDVTPDR
ncbi:uncharacterized protein MYCFIDRAFT_130551 [Pseudocercospora fijiensis CIRAD86]|uniref:DNA methylase adenine-specific domain-containing protein n=1 Tax=Pseudocercospora fijiensis (strain CIRAD86) TaxID=383855 RepID=M3B7J1_PSEFD|nr:uncharacterized protein MYCFIDRAFT_130551 [Pseudocercospora fijiensis CIRAD86]EME85283.1 hypothetical protein MYCFIDRAFT_130551 [Pseudocercospora fijiensis CIRAD86]